MTKEINSWGQNHRKFVSVHNQNKKITNQVISVGNLNSYGDACIPINNNLIMNHHKTSENKDYVFNFKPLVK